MQSGRVHPRHRINSHSAVLSSPHHCSPLHSASVHITEFQSSTNPRPQSTNQGHDYLSPSQLRELTGTTNLDSVTCLELAMNSSEHSLGNFGAYLPRLAHLRLTDSVLPCVRDLGTSLTAVRVLWLPQSRLRDLDGLTSLPNLKELYMAFNEVSDISLVTMLSALEVLDVEGNNLAELDQLGYLSLCPVLTTLILQGNPLHTTLAKREGGERGYRVAVGTAIPQLNILDDLPLQSEGGLSTPSPPTPTLQWAELDTDLNVVHSSLRLRPQQSRKEAVLTIRPKTAPVQRGVMPTLQDSTSELTHGLHQVMCGNPVRALKARKHQLMASESSVSTPSPPPIRSELASNSQHWRPHSVTGGAVSFSLQEECLEVTKARSEENLFEPSSPPVPPPYLPSPPDHLPTPHRPHSVADFRHRRYHRPPTERDSYI